MKIVIRSTIILIISFLVGFIYNQIHPQGIHWRYLFQISSRSESSLEITLADSALALLSDPRTLIVDTRPEVDYELDRISGAINIHVDMLVQNQDRFLKTDYSYVVFYDQDGQIEKLTFFLSPINFNRNSNYYILYGGFMGWLEKGYPVDEGISYEK
jgi:rhodanese-related sulfurtransferase